MLLGSLSELLCDVLEGTLGKQVEYASARAVNPVYADLVVNEAEGLDLTYASVCPGPVTNFRKGLELPL